MALRIRLLEFLPMFSSEMTVGLLVHAPHGTSPTALAYCGGLFAENRALASISTSVIRSTIGISRWYAGRIRQGYRQSPDHRQALAERDHLISLRLAMALCFTG